MSDVRAVRRSRIPVLVFLVLLLVAMSVAVSGCGQAAASDTGSAAKLYRIMIQGLYAYADQTGRIVIPRQFEYAGPFREGLAAVTTYKPGGAGESFYIDTSGKVVMKPGGLEFSEGLAMRSDDWGRVWFVDRTGKTVIPGPFCPVDTLFTNGLAVVGVYPDERGIPLFGVIDTTGRWVVPAQFQQISTFSEGLAAVQTAEGLWGYVDTAGRMAVPPQFTDGEGYPSAGSFTDGLAAVRTDAGYGFIAPNGAWVIPAQFQRARGFAEGLAAVRNGDGLWGFIDRSGAWAIPAHFARVGVFQQGMSTAESGGLQGFIDRAGAWVISPQFKELWGFSEGLAAAQMPDGKWGYIDEAGTMVIAAEYQWVESFQDGVAIVRPLGNTDYLIDRTGKRLTPASMP